MERFLSFDRFIAFHRNKLDVQPIPSDKLTIGYGNMKYEMFHKHLQEGDPDMVKKVIKEINDQMQDGTEVYNYSIKNPILLSAVFHYLGDNLAEIRELSSLCFLQFCRILITKQELFKDDYIKFCQYMLNDSSKYVRLNSVHGLIYYAQSRYGIDSLLQNKILELVIKKISEEQDEQVLDSLMTLSLELLNGQGAPQVSLSCDFIKILKGYVNHSNLDILENVIKNLGSISLCEEGKTACVEASLIENILTHLKKLINLPILISSTRFLKSTSILKAGKVQIYEMQGLETCLALLEKYDDEQLILDILQILGNVAEEPRGRKKMLENLKFVERFLTHEFFLISSQAKITREIIVWKP